jgi:hypothetical protein
MQQNNLILYDFYYKNRTTTILENIFKRFFRTIKYNKYKEDVLQQNNYIPLRKPLFENDFLYLYEDFIKAYNLEFILYFDEFTKQISSHYVFDENIKIINIDYYNYFEKNFLVDISYILTVINHNKGLDFLLNNKPQNTNKNIIDINYISLMNTIYDRNFIHNINRDEIFNNILQTKNYKRFEISNFKLIFIRLYLIDLCYKEFKPKYNIIDKKRLLNIISNSYNLLSFKKDILFDLNYDYPKSYIDFNSDLYNNGHSDYKAKARIFF